MRRLSAFLLLAVAIAACGENAARDRIAAPVAETDTITILALGDSYTIGEGVTEAARWPAQLADSLAARNIVVERVTYVAQTGWTTGALLTAMEPLLTSGVTFDLVTVLIGVNNQFAQLDIDDYGLEFEEVLAGALAFAAGDTARVIVLSIPDYGVTPVGMRFDAEKVAAEIDAFNAVNRAITDSYGIAYIDITPLSREAENDPTLVARDGLHYSGTMYARWVSLVLPAVPR